MKQVTAIVQRHMPANVVHALHQQVAHTGHSGDGIITVTNLAEVIRIRTGEQQERAA
jgi:nitrogen regulatory protein PII